MRNRARVVIAVLAVGLVGCASEPRFAFRSQPAAAIAPIQRLQVYAPIADILAEHPVPPEMYESFRASLALRLSLCRVPVEIASTEPPSAAGSSDAGSVLTIRIVDKQFTVVHLYSQYNQLIRSWHEGTAYFGMELAAPAAHPVWSARASFRYVAPSYDAEDHEVFGAGFARGIVAQLQRDGLLTSCIHEAYPGCVADLREQLLRIQKAREAPGRPRLVLARKELPDCKVRP